MVIDEEGRKIFNIKHRCFHFAKEIIEYVKEADYKYAFQSLYSQLVKAGTSVGANVVEGSAGSSKKDFINFYTIALKSSNETKYWLSLIKDTLDNEKEVLLNSLIEEADQISKIIAKIIINSKQ